MGIKGLLQALAPAIEKGFHIENLEAGTTVAIDGHGWLHRACYSCSLELALEMPTRQYIDFFLHRLRMLMHHGLRPLVVFDGNRPTMKRDVEQSRRDRRLSEKERGLALWRSAQSLPKHSTQRDKLIRDARDCFGRSVQVTSALVHGVLAALKAEGVPFLVAPFEADAQLAELAKLEKANVIVSEDSDVPVFLLASGAAATVLFKLTSEGLADRLHVASPVQWSHQTPAATPGTHTPTEPSPSPSPSESPSSRSAFLRKLAGFSASMFVQMCLLAGCDYLPSIPRVGLATAQKWILRVKEGPDFTRIGRLLQIVRREKKFDVPEDYGSSFQAAEACFNHHVVFDPDTKRLEHLTPLPSVDDDNNEEEVTDGASDDDGAAVWTRFVRQSINEAFGPLASDSHAQAVAEGVIDSRTGAEIPEPPTLTTKTTATPAIAVAQPPRTGSDLFAPVANVGQASSSFSSSSSPSSSSIVTSPSRCAATFRTPSKTVDASVADFFAYYDVNATTALPAPAAPATATRTISGGSPLRRALQKTSPASSTANCRKATPRVEPLAFSPFPRTSSGQRKKRERIEKAGTDLLDYFALQTLPKRRRPGR